MRRPSDLPGDQPRRTRLRTPARTLAIGAVVVLFVVFVVGRALARFYVDELWFDSLAQPDVFWTALRAKATLFGLYFVAFALLSGVNLAVADQLAPSRFPINVHPYVERFHDTFGRRMRIYRFLFAGLVGVLVALPTTARWQDWLLYRNSTSFERSDFQFGVDVGFYVFELPFLSFVLDWLFIAVAIVLVLTVITHVLNGAVVFASPIPSVSQAMKGHVAVIAALLAVVKAADYWVRRYESTNSTRGFIQGPTYSVVHAQLPALLLLAIVALVTAGLYLSTLRTHTWRIPLVASAVWLVLAIVGGYVYPAAIQSLVVRPNQNTREAPFIEHNVYATREAMGITDLDVRRTTISFGNVSSSAIESNPTPLENVRLLNPVDSRARFERSVGQVAGLKIYDLDIDRYPDDDGEVVQMLVAAKELNLSGAANKTWQGRHLISTHGCGLVRAPASSVRTNGNPAFEDVELDRPELYFSPDIGGWAVAGTQDDAIGCDGGEAEPYEGTSGVAMSSWWRKAAFSLAFMDYNLIGSGAVDGDAQMLWNRNVRDRVSKLAPFLTFDGDPYPVELDGRVLWVVDGYTSTSRYPGAESVGADVALTERSGIPRNANYIRNSVKAVVDAYDGTVNFYVVDPDDPIVQAWRSAFPSLFDDADAMPDGLADHLRYPEDLFRVQTHLYSKYQLDPADFFDRKGAWSVAQGVSRSGGGATNQPAASEEDPAEVELAVESSNNRFDPYYTLFGGVADDEEAASAESFVLIRPFVPFSVDDGRTELQAFMTASSNGELTVYTMGGSPLPEGPRGVAVRIQTDPVVSERIGEIARSDAAVQFGDLQLVPVGDGILWVRPVYIQASLESGSGTQVTDFLYVAVEYGGEVALSDSLEGAIDQLFPGTEITLDDRVASAPIEGEETDPPPGELIGPETESSLPGIEAGSDVPSDVLVRVASLLADARAARLAGDLATYQAKVDEATELLAQYVSVPSETTPDTVADDDPADDDPADDETADDETGGDDDVGDAPVGTPPPTQPG